MAAEAEPDAFRRGDTLPVHDVVPADGVPWPPCRLLHMPTGQVPCGLEAAAGPAGVGVKTLRAPARTGPWVSIPAQPPTS